MPDRTLNTGVYNLCPTFTDAGSEQTLVATSIDMRLVVELKKTKLINCLSAATLTQNWSLPRATINYKEQHNDSGDALCVKNASQTKS